MTKVIYVFNCNPDQTRPDNDFYCPPRLGKVFLFQEEDGGRWVEDGYSDQETTVRKQLKSGGGWFRSQIEGIWSRDR